MLGSLLLVLHLWPRGMLIICFVCFLSFVSAAQDFAGYQSDGMLLEAGFIALFFSPPGFRPGLTSHNLHPATRASFVLVAVGVVSRHRAFRVRARWRSFCAGTLNGGTALHGHGRVLPERTFAHLG